MAKTEFKPYDSADYLNTLEDIGYYLEAVLEEAPDFSAALGAIFTLAREECVVETRVSGEIVHTRTK